jgi:hypothetical protein
MCYKYITYVLKMYLTERLNSVIVNIFCLARKEIKSTPYFSGSYSDLSLNEPKLKGTVG